MGKEFRHIVRITGKDINGNKPIYHALTQITGIGSRFGRVIAKKFEEKTGTKFDSKIGEINEQEEKIIEDIILNPLKYGIPAWMLNRRKDIETGEDLHLTMGELYFKQREDLKRLNRIKSYRGLRHSWGLPVRGQRTKSTHRGKGPVVGVTKKDAKKGK